MSEKFIYVSGDSFLAGEELADDTLQCWKDMYGKYVLLGNTVDAREQRREKFYLQFTPEKAKELNSFSDEQLFTFRQMKKDRTFWSVVANNLGLNTHCDAQGGCCQESILHRAMISFNNFKLVNKKVDLAIIGLSPPDRFMYYRNNVPPHNNDIWFKQNITETYGFDASLVVGHHGWVSSNETQTKLLNTLIMVEQEQGAIVRQLSCLYLTKIFFKKKTGKYPIFISPCSNHEIFNNPKLLKIPEYKILLNEFLEDINIYDMSNFSNVHDSVYNRKNFKFGLEVCPGGHHTPKHHADFAKFVEPFILTGINHEPD